MVIDEWEGRMESFLSMYVDACHRKKKKVVDFKMHGSKKWEQNKTKDSCSDSKFMFNNE